MPHQKKVVVQKIIEVLKNIQELGEFERVDLDANSRPLKEMSEFDSQLWVVAITLLADELDVIIPDNVNVFVTEDGTGYLDIDEIAQKILDNARKD